MSLNVYFHSNHANSIYVKSVIGNYDDTVEIKDSYFYNSFTSNANGFNVPSSVSSSSIYGFNSDGWKFGNVSSYTSMSSTVTPTVPFEVDFTMTELSNNGLTLLLGSSHYVAVNSNSSLTIDGTELATRELNKEYQVKVYSDKIEVYLEGTLLGSKTVTMSSIAIKLDTGSSRYIRLKDFMINLL